MTRARCKDDGWNDKLSIKYILKKLVIYLECDELALQISDWFVIDREIIQNIPLGPAVGMMVEIISYSTKYILKKLVVYLDRDQLML